MQAIAREIAITQPDLVGLERSYSMAHRCGTRIPTDVLFDPLQELA